MSERESDADFTVSEECHALRMEFAELVSAAASSLVVSLIRSGLSQAKACAVVTHTLIDFAAGSACRTRRELLGGEPDIARWRSVTDRAFERAVKRTAPAQCDRSPQGGAAFSGSVLLHESAVREADAP